MARGQPRRSEEPWTSLQNRTECKAQIKLTRCGKITLGILLAVVAAVVIGLIAYFVACGKAPFYYHVSFKVHNIDYDSKFAKPYSEEYMDLNKRSFLCKANGKVVLHVVLKFKACYENNVEKFWNSIETTLYQKLKGQTGLLIDPSTFKFSDISMPIAEDLLNTCCGRRTITPGGHKVAGGQDADEGEWPWQASLQQNSVHRCGATLISNNWLITAAHCFVRDTNPKNWKVSFGLLLNKPQIQRTVKNIIIHENYSYPAHDNDIAVVRMSSPVLYESNIRRACLPEATQQFPPNSDVVVTGWGTLKSDGESPNILQKGRVKVIDNETCNSGKAYGGVIKPGMLCAGFLEGRVDACQGDSGGPLVSEDAKGIWFVAGIVSWGDECALPNKPGVYTRVTYYRDWIASKTGL